MIKLYGSTTSPFVRRLRMWLANIDHEFISLEIFTQGDRELLAQHNPTLKIPMIEYDQQFIFDSRVIFRFLSNKLGYPALSWEQENQLTLIDAATDSLVQMLLLSRSDIDTSGDQMYFKLQRERVDKTLSHLNEMVLSGEFDSWHYPSICLYSLVDWVEFRMLHDLVNVPALRDFHQRNHQRIEVTATDPRT